MTQSANDSAPQSHAKKNQASSMLNYLGVIALGILIVVLIFWLLTRGHTTEKKDNSDGAVTTSLSCTAASIKNDIFSTDDAVSTSYRVDAIFNDDKLNNITFYYTGVYDDESAAKKAEMNIHADFSKALGRHHLQEDHFSGTTYSSSGNEASLTNFAQSSDINDQSTSLLFIDYDKDNPNAKIPSSYNEIKNNYEGRGFSCKKGA